ncbi:phage tail-collar fiber domain-containing protein [Vibrio parahaemolyticus]|uniref:phage tail-collar fiber domain-containing protein n=1 Tax=Vibrio parahaemolyticus TaxID=670 RepID=UPI0009AB2531|nr:phage tail protein [Vibrio parahaemolyticus]
MANSTDKSILTAAGKALLAQLNAEEKALVIDKMIFANVPNRPEYPQPDDVVPTDHIVHQEQVEQRGRLSADSVIYSSTLTSDVGPFDFNWTGAYCSEYGVLVTIDHHALTPKTADEPGVAGNTLVRSVVLEYKDIAEITNITVDASSWQYNATERMKKMDSDVAQSIIDQNGKDWFIEDGFLVTPSGSAYNIKAGAGYVSGNRVAMEFDRSVQVPNKPSFIYIDAHREGTPTGEQVTLFNFVVTAEEKDDYIDSSTGKDVKHFVCKIAQVHADGSVSDLRPEGESASRKYVNDTSLTVSEQISAGKTWPRDINLALPIGNQDTVVSELGVTRLIVDTGTVEKGEVLYLWEFSGDFYSAERNINKISLNVYGGYDVKTTSGTFEFTSEKIRKYRLENNILGWNIDDSGTRSSEEQLAKLALYSNELLILPKQKLRTAYIPMTFNKFHGGGRLIYDHDSENQVIHKMPSGFVVSDFKIETIYRNRLVFHSDDLTLNLVKEYQSDVREDQARYNCVEWHSDGNIMVTSHATYKTGFRARAKGRVSISNMVTRVNHVGEGPDGNNHGVDGIKITESRGIIIDNHQCFGSSRDIIDTFVGGGECNITNIWADTYYFNQIEIKSVGTDAPDPEDTAHDINITNVVSGPGGKGSNDTFAALLIYNQNEGDDSTSPRRVNITNYTAREIGLNADGQYYAVRASGSFDLNFVNTNLLYAKNYGLSATRCKNIKLTNSNIHGLTRGASLIDCSKVTLSSSSIGYDEETDSWSQYGIFTAGVCEEVCVSAGSHVYGSSRSISAENSRINDFKADTSFFNGPARIDMFSSVSFHNCDLDALSDPSGGVDAFLSGTASPSEELSFIGGKIMNARRGINEQSLTLLQCLGVRFENLQSPVGGGSADNRRIITNCFSKNAGDFPTPSGSDVIKDNIKV